MGNKSFTVGYWYRMGFHFGLCRGPVDALLEFRAGDRPAWVGSIASNADINVENANLWGGESGEGGVSGTMSVLLGGTGQPLHGGLVGLWGAQQGAYRGRATVLFNGAWGAYNPYPKPAAFKVRRVLKGWDNDAPWYPEKAMVLVAPGEVFTEDMAFPAGLATVDGSYAGLEITSGITPDDILVIEKPPGLTYKAWSAWAAGAAPGGLAWMNHFMVTDGHGTTTRYWGIEDPDGWPRYATPEEAEAAFAGSYVLLTGSNYYKIWLSDTPVFDNRGGLSLRVYKNGVISMNAAHILYDSIISQDMMGEPVSAVDDASFRAAADILYNEGFGLCTSFDATIETIESFQARICNVIGGALTRDRRTGLWNLDLLRGGGNPESLPVLTDDDILDYASEPSTLDDAVNQVVVEWTDPVAKESRSTAPLQALGLIQAFGGVVAESLSYPEIPGENLALRVGARDLIKKATPLRRFELKTNRTPYAWRAGTYFRLEAPKRGISGMTCLVGEIDVGTLRQGAITLTAVEDIFSMPDSVYIQPQPPLPPDVDTPEPSPHERLVEAPYIELVRRLPRSELQALAESSGYVLSLASAPASGWNYSLAAAAAGEDLKERTAADWTPACVVSAAVGKTEVSVAFSAQTGLEPGLFDDVELPAAAIWDEEIVRVDVVDLDTGTLTLGRGCADTVPAEHAADSVMYFFGLEAGTDEREYSGGETVSAKVLTRVRGGQLAQADAATLTCDLDDRAARPYPPAKLRINTELWPDMAVFPLVVDWVHRDRIVQADQLVDTDMAGIGPEPGTTYTVRVRRADTNALLAEAAGIVGTSVTLGALAYDGQVLVQAFSERDGLASLQMQQHFLDYAEAEARETEDGEPRVTEDGQPRVLES